MPRASQYLIEGYTYHLTHRCHGKQFLLKSRLDRQRYREWLREGVSRFDVPVYAYCVTRNHVHVVAHATTRAAISGLMHLAAGALAKHYNTRNERHGSMWEHPYHCTLVQDGTHLLNCLRYVDLNMVRAGVVRHPRDWPWCGYDELTGRRRRYRILNLEDLAERAGFATTAELKRWYAEAVEQHLSSERIVREPHWTESLAIGDQHFVQNVTANYPQRIRLDLSQTSNEAWAVREPHASYATGMQS